MSIWLLAISTDAIVYDPDMPVNVRAIVSPARNQASQKLPNPFDPTREFLTVGFDTPRGNHHDTVFQLAIEIVLDVGVPPFTFLSDVPDTRDSTRVMPPCQLNILVVLFTHTYRSILWSRSHQDHPQNSILFQNPVFTSSQAHS